mgnify:FL=1
MVTLQNPYNNKIPKKYDGCPINVTWDVIDLAIKTPFNRTDPGYIIRLLDTVAGNLNLSIIYLKEAIPYIALAHLSGTYDDLKREMVTKNIDLSIVTSGSSKLFEPELDITHFFLEECIFFALPPRRKIRLGISILLIFSSEIWGLILISTLFMAGLWKSLTATSLENCFFEVIHLILKGAIIKTPGSTKQKIFFAIFLFYVMHLNSIYVSQLSGILSKPSFEPKISTIGELAKSNKKLRFVKIYEVFFVNRYFHETCFLR